MKNKLGIFVVLFAMVVGYGCEGQNEEDVSTAAASTEAQTASIGVKASLDSGSTASMKNALGTSDEIVSITVGAALTSDGTALASTALENIDGIWEGTLEALPYDVSITFTALAQDSDSVAIFSGTLEKTLVAGADNDIVLALSSVDDGVEPENPVVSSITMPEKILIDSDPELITIQFNSTATVDYTIAVTSGGLGAAFSDTPAASISGVHDPSSSLQIFYSAPSTAGVAQLTVSIREQGSSDEIGASFFLTVVSYDPDTWTDSGVSVVVGPAITDMAFLRSVDTLKVTVTTAPDTAITYEWAGTGDFASLNATGNPVFITGFDDTQSGTITVTATDANNLTAFVTRTVQAGDFPYTVNEYITDMPGLYIFDETTDLMWQDNTNKISRKWADAGSYCADLNLAGYTVWRLPTRSELVNMFDRRVDFSNYYASEYWSADEDPGDSTRAFTISFSDAGEQSASKTQKKLVRCVKD